MANVIETESGSSIDVLRSPSRVRGTDPKGDGTVEPAGATKGISELELSRVGSRAWRNDLVVVGGVDMRA